MDQLKMTGGARIGMANATWPFVTLTVTKDRLDLNVDKTVEFVPQISGQDVPVVSVEIVPLLLGN